MSERAGGWRKSARVSRRCSSVRARVCVCVPTTSLTSPPTDAPVVARPSSKQTNACWRNSHTLTRLHAHACTHTRICTLHIPTCTPTHTYPHAHTHIQTTRTRTLAHACTLDTRAHTNAHAHACAHLHIHTRTHTCTYIRARIRMHTRAHTRTCTHTCTCTCTHAHAQTCTHTHTNTCTHMQKRAHTYTHTHTHSQTTITYHTEFAFGAAGADDAGRLAPRPCKRPQCERVTSPSCGL
jgi:hypothetical protein